MIQKEIVIKVNGMEETVQGGSIRTDDTHYFISSKKNEHTKTPIFC